MSASHAPGDASAAAEFVEHLMAELATGPLELPGFPEVTTRVRQALADPDVTAAEVSRIVATEPVLAACVLQLANSAALNVTHAPIATLQNAIGRVGFNVVRLAALALALAQLERRAELQEIAPELRQLWQRSTAMAAVAHTLVRRKSTCSPDEALLAGLLCGVGRLYLLSRSTSFPGIRHAATGAWEALVQQWHAEIARSVLQSWNLPQSVVQAVYRHTELGEEHDGPADLVDFLQVSSALVDDGLRADSIAPGMMVLPAARRIGLEEHGWRELLVHARRAVDELRASLRV